MLPALIGLVDTLPFDTGYGILMWGHHFLGLVVIGLWIFINLGVSGKITITGRLRGVMWLALSTWAISLAMGLFLYSRLWPWPWQ